MIILSYGADTYVYFFKSVTCYYKITNLNDSYE